MSGGRKQQEGRRVFFLHWANHLLRLRVTIKSNRGNKAELHHTRFYPDIKHYQGKNGKKRSARQ